ncbi:MAG: VOC family protein [Planctomycetota bacterium]
MSDQEQPVLGSIGWRDLTVPPEETAAVRDFYAAVAGWTIHEVDMGGYADYAMLDASGQPAAGVCHAQGVNATMPPQWILYVHIADLDASLAQVTANGGKVIVPERSMGDARFAVIQDPAGAMIGLYQA